MSDSDPHLSDDGLWRWNGQEWVSTGKAAVPTPGQSSPDGRHVWTEATGWQPIDPPKAPYWTQRNIVAGLLAVLIGGVVLIFVIASVVSENANQQRGRDAACESLRENYDIECDE